MIGVGSTIKGSAKALAYIQEDKGEAIVIEKNKILSDQPNEQYGEMRHIAETNHFTQKKFYSAVLSPSKESTAEWTIQEWEQLSQDFARKMKIDGNQYISTLHTSSGQPHLHFIANRIDYAGKNKITAHDIDKQTQKVAEELANAYGFKTAIEVSKEKNQKRTREKEQMKADLKQALRVCTSQKELAESMKTKGYALHYNLRNNEVIGLRIVQVLKAKQLLEEKQQLGIKPTYKEGSYKLSELDRTMKVKDIEKQLESNKQLEIQPSEKRGIRR